mmetsp:Transcript_7711/g.10567  ORF Transcript_7711/g.10567 Transcript_7711/m.10567 type:complete len:323 (-) Transcript_7711:172-1140(-)
MSAAALAANVVKGSESITMAATMMCLRKRKNTNNTPGSNSMIRIKVDQLPLVERLRQAFFLDHGQKELEVNASWDVLMGQRPVVNWPRSSPEKVKIMNYPGEFVLPGGKQDKGESLRECAVREFEEEVLADGRCLPDPENVKLIDFFAFTTKRVRGMKHRIHNFLAFESQNPWIKEINVSKFNEEVDQKLEKEEQLLSSGEYWRLNPHSRRSVGSEMRRLQWIPLHEAVLMTMSSVPRDDMPTQFVNDYQRKQFQKYELKDRDPMMATMFALLAVGQCTNEDQLYRDTPLSSSSEEKRATLKRKEKASTKGNGSRSKLKSSL